ncbi:MAG TPA: hypothetical protein VJ953_08940 [Saprospiraceae bacterium]|nr:hypothetical protein [Saprospiraceae bacterium]
MLPHFLGPFDHGGLTDQSFDVSFNGLSIWDFEDTLNEADQSLLMDHFDADGHKLGAMLLLLRLIHAPMTKGEEMIFKSYKWIPMST